MRSRDASDGVEAFEQAAGRSPAIREALEQVAQWAPRTALLLLGEAGTGKAVLARAIHARSPRCERPFVAVEAAALAQRAEGELFDPVERARGGTLFVDEVAELPPAGQLELLRLLGDGGPERAVDVRIVAASRRDLARAAAEGRLRADLHERLSAFFAIRLPPLRERREEIPLLVWELIRCRQRALGRRIERVPEIAMQALTLYSWPGNVRELASVIEHALFLSPGPVLRLDAAFAGQAKRAERAERLDEVERTHFLNVLERCRWRISGSGSAAEALGMSPSTLRSRLKKLRVTRPAARSSA
jgi:DNA-binding NtrC family response regulator